MTWPGFVAALVCCGVCFVAGYRLGWEDLRTLADRRKGIRL